MKGFLKNLKRQDGFTLVELMVVVAIIGVLSAVAIPNFKKYQAKAKVSEAKLQLSSIYTAETSFYADFNMYHNCLDYMGYNPAPEMPSRYFATGFSAVTTAINAGTHASAQNSGMNIVNCPATATSVEGNAAYVSSATAASATWFPAGKASAGAIANTQAFLGTSALGAQDGTAAGNTFVASAGGIISSDAAYNTATTAALLTINQAKVIGTTRNGY
ncbi:MAG: prepilin-type N-terminal cleavage/methylation domain-containing protein [Bacteriovoracaceae bacterium]